MEYPPIKKWTIGLYNITWGNCVCKKLFSKGYLLYVISLSEVLHVDVTVQLSLLEFQINNYI